MWRKLRLRQKNGFLIKKRESVDKTLKIRMNKWPKWVGSPLQALCFNLKQWTNFYEILACFKTSVFLLVLRGAVFLYIIRKGRTCTHSTVIKRGNMYLFIFLVTWQVINLQNKNFSKRSTDEILIFVNKFDLWKSILSALFSFTPYQDDDT